MCDATVLNKWEKYDKVHYKLFHQNCKGVMNVIELFQLNLSLREYT